jgi:hypothetical protein
LEPGKGTAGYQILKGRQKKLKKISLFWILFLSLRCITKCIEDGVQQDNQDKESRHSVCGCFNAVSQHQKAG